MEYENKVELHQKCIETVERNTKCSFIEKTLVQSGPLESLELPPCDHHLYYQCHKCNVFINLRIDFENHRLTHVKSIPDYCNPATNCNADNIECNTPAKMVSKRSNIEAVNDEIVEKAGPVEAPNENEKIPGHSRRRSWLTIFCDMFCLGCLFSKRKL